MTFEPSDYRPLYTNGHVQTLYAWAKPRTFPRLPEPVPRYFDVAPDARVLAHCHWHARPGRTIRRCCCCTASKGRARPTTCGGISDKAWAGGWNVVRLNQRNCGDTEHLSRGLYHSGLTNDPAVRDA